MLQGTPTKRPRLLRREKQTPKTGTLFLTVRKSFSENFKNIRGVIPEKFRIGDFEIFRTNCLNSEKQHQHLLILDYDCQK